LDKIIVTCKKDGCQNYVDLLEVGKQICPECLLEDLRLFNKEIEEIEKEIEEIEDEVGEIEEERDEIVDKLEDHEKSLNNLKIRKQELLSKTHLLFFR
jgi:chromosome segregation ATPase